MTTATLLAPVLLLVLVALAVVVVRHQPALPPVPDGTGLEAVRGATVLARLAGAVAFVVVVAWLVSLGGLGWWAAAAPGLGAAAALAMVALGEVSVWRRARTPGSASLERRRLRGYVSGRVVGRTLGVTAAAAATLAYAVAIAGTGTDGIPGRSLVATCHVAADADVGPVTSVTSPFPGSFYTVPVAGSLVVAWIIAAVAAWATVRRPRNGAHPGIVRLDDVLRSRSMEAIGALLSLGTGAALLAVCLVAVPRTLFSDCATVAQRSFTVVGVLAALVGVHACGWATARLVRPTTQVER